MDFCHTLAAGNLIFAASVAGTLLEQGGWDKDARTREAGEHPPQVLSQGFGEKPPWAHPAIWEMMTSMKEVNSACSARSCSHSSLPSPGCVRLPAASQGLMLRTDRCAGCAGFPFASSATKVVSDLCVKPETAGIRRTCAGKGGGAGRLADAAQPRQRRRRRGGTEAARRRRRLLRQLLLVLPQVLQLLDIALQAHENQYNHKIRGQGMAGARSP